MNATRAMALVLVVVGCDAADYETEHLRITLNYDGLQCAGDLDTYEQSIDVLEAELGRKLEAPLDVDLWRYHDWDGAPREKHCSGSGLACYSRRKHHIFGILGTKVFRHEMVHAILQKPSDKMFQEGAAEALSEWTEFGWTRPALTPEDGTISYVASGHFVRWLLETRGRECVLAVLAVPHDDAEATFAAHCAGAFDAAVEEYSQTAAWIYPSPFGCDFTMDDVVLLELEGLDLDVSIDCDEIDATAHEGGMSVTRRLEVEQAGHFTVWTNAGSAIVSRCERETIPIAPHYWISDDRIPQINSFNARGTLNGRVTGRVWLDPGEYHLTVGVAGWDAQTVRVRLDPTVPIERVP